MAAIPVWAVGRHVTAYTLTPQTVATDGTLADTTPVQTMYGHLQEIELESTALLENISAMDRRAENNVIIETATVYRCTELLKSSGTNKLAQAAYGAADVFKIVLTRGGQSFTGFGIISSYRETMTKPRLTAQFELRMVDPGTTNPVYA